MGLLYDRLGPDKRVKAQKEAAKLRMPFGALPQEPVDHPDIRPLLYQP